MARLIDTPEVARRLGVSVERFYRMRKDLDAAGFPAPKAPFKHRWADVAVDAWIADGGAAAGDGADRKGGAVPVADPADDDLDAWKQTLRERARAAAM